MGPVIDDAALRGYDQLLHRSLQRCLGHLDPFALEQAGLGVVEGGLGVRGASQLALPAFVASRVDCRWIVDSLARKVDPRWRLRLMESFDAQTAQAQAELQSRLPPVAAGQVEAIVGEAAEARAPLDGALPQIGRRRGLASANRGLISPAGHEDAEAAGLQSALSAVCDRESKLALLDKLRAADPVRHRTLLDLSDVSVSHDWLWRTSPCHGPLVPPSEFQGAVRIRLGAPLGRADGQCSRCGANLDGNAHGLKCAAPEATRRHYDVRDSPTPAPRSSPWA